jgi:hypothetical protein
MPSRFTRCSHPSPEKHYPHVYYPLLQSLFHLNRDEELVAHARQCIRVAQFSGDAAYFLVLSLYRQRLWAEVCDLASTRSGWKCRTTRAW